MRVLQDRVDKIGLPAGHGGRRWRRTSPPFPDWYADWFEEHLRAKSGG